jgi:SAM-dependent methyltransferase
MREGKHVCKGMEIAAAVADPLGAKYRWSVDLLKFDLEVLVYVFENRLVFGVTIACFEPSRNRVVDEAFEVVTALHPQSASALLQLCDVQAGDLVVDPMCGVGTIPIEGALQYPSCRWVGGDLDPRPLSQARAHATHTGVTNKVEFQEWDACALPLRSGTVDVFVSDLPFGRRHGSHAANKGLYPRLLRELCRCLVPDGKAVLLALDKHLMREATALQPRLSIVRELQVDTGGYETAAFLIRKASTSNSTDATLEEEAEAILRAGGGVGGGGKSVWCVECGVSLTSGVDFAQHILGKKHRERTGTAADSHTHHQAADSSNNTADSSNKTNESSSDKANSNDNDDGNDNGNDNGNDSSDDSSNDSNNDNEDDNEDDDNSNNRNNNSNTSYNSNSNKKTRFPALQQQLDEWVVLLSAVDGASADARQAAVTAFTALFVPLDLDPDDFEHFSSGLAGDAAWFASLAAEVRTCASGEGVTELSEEEDRESVFGFKGLQEGGSDNIFREVVFVCVGGQWRAEG